ncbi:MAG: zinc-dependent metalloprotease [Thermoleophilaceae bacterium]|nr:zinc-dependent metalloprotease [Thermoleophilaceae bacterium]
MIVDWGLARQIAGFAAGSDPTPALGVDLQALADAAEGQVAGYTGLALSGACPPAEALDRRAWAEVNLATLADFLDPVGERLGGRMEGAGPLAGALRAAAGATLAAEAGLVVGYMSQKVLGQFELSLMQPESAPRLLFVTPNLDRTLRQHGELDRESFIGWVVLHEMTHVLQFGGVPWLRGHMSALLQEYLRSVEVRIERGQAGGLPSMPDPARIIESFREGGLVALVQTREQRSIMGRMQATMAVIEGYSEHVMDAVGEQVLPHYAGLREAMDRRRRSRSTPERILMKLLGMDMKMRQYEDGKRFCDAVADRHGLERLNRVWAEPGCMPALSELSEPDTWAARVAPQAVPA